MPEGFHYAGYAAIAICAIMVVFNLALVRKRGASAILMASSFVVFAGIVHALMEPLSDTVTIALAVVLVLILLADFVVRAMRKVKPK